MRPLRAAERVRIEVPGITTAPAAVRAASCPASPDQLWAADLSVAWTGSGSLYVAAVLGGYTHHCLGWSTQSQLGPELVLEAVTLAALSKGEEASSCRTQVALALAPVCAAAGVAVPRGSSPSAIDGAVTHSFFSMLRRELASTPAWRTRTDTAEAIAGWISGTYSQDRVGTVSRLTADALLAST